MLSSPTRRALAVTIVIAVVLAGIALTAWARVQTSSFSGGEPTIVVVPDGASGADVATLLEQHDVVRNAFAFRLVARSRGVAGSVQAGNYPMVTGLSADDAIGRLEAGPDAPDELHVTLIEGLPLTKMLDQLAEQTPHTTGDYQEILDAQRDGSNPLTLPSWWPDPEDFSSDILHPLEGVLSADTYRIDPKGSPGEILQRLIDQTSDVMAAIDDDARAQLADRGMTRYDAYILASLLERSAPAGQRPELSGVLHDRLDRGWPLDTPASLEYEHEMADRGPNPQAWRSTPYNTHQNVGLPPTPVASPSPSALHAAFNPSDTDALWWIADPACDGSIRMLADADDLDFIISRLARADWCDSYIYDPRSSID